MLDNLSNQPSKFKTRNWVEINDESRGTYTGNSSKFKTTMLGSNLCDYGDAYKLVNGTITITGRAGAQPNLAAPRNAEQLLAARQADERDKGVIFKNCAPFVKCISRINNTETDNAKDIDIVMPKYNYSKTPGSMWQYYNMIQMIIYQTLNHLNLK